MSKTTTQIANELHRPHCPGFPCWGPTLADKKLAEAIADDRKVSHD